MENINYEKKIYITFDFDWADDDVLEDTIEIVENAQIKATFFVTHETKHLSRLSNNSLIELGVHPNFRPLFERHNDLWVGVDSILSNVRELVPEAQSIRCHSLVQSSPLLNLFCEHGYTHDVNQLIPIHSKMILFPYYHWNKKLIRVPFFWEDDIHCLDLSSGLMSDWPIDDCLNYMGIKVFNFHPIHLFLNTENLKRYEKTRSFHNQVRILKKHRFINGREGTRAFFLRLIEEAKKRNMEFGLIKEIQL